MWAGRTPEIAQYTYSTVKTFSEGFSTLSMTRTSTGTGRFQLQSQLLLEKAVFVIRQGGIRIVAGGRWRAAGKRRLSRIGCELQREIITARKSLTDLPRVYPSSFATGRRIAIVAGFLKLNTVPDAFFRNSIQECPSDRPGSW